MNFGFSGGWPKKSNPQLPAKTPKILEQKIEKRSSALGNTVPGSFRIQPVQLSPPPPQPRPEVVLKPQVIHPGPPNTLPANRSGIAIVGRFETWPWGQHPDEAYLADALEACGAKVYRVDQSTSDRPIYDAEWVIFTGQPDSWGRMPEWASTHQTILWTLDWLPDDVERAPIIEAGTRATLFVSSDRFDWASRGMRTHFYLQGACEGIEPRFDPKPKVKCAFMGSVYNDRREAIAKTVKRLGGTVLASPGKWVYGQDLAKLVQETKVVVGDNIRNDVPGYWSSRNYIIPGAGGFLLTAAVPGLEADFSIGEHLAIYGSMKALAEVIEFYASHDREREKIRRAGFLHVRKNHSWKARARALLQRIGVRV